MLVVVEEGDRSMVADRGANARLTAGRHARALDAGAVLVSGYLLLQEPGHDVRTGSAREGRRARSWRSRRPRGRWWSVGAARFLDETAPATLVVRERRRGERPRRADRAAAARALGERYAIAAVKHGAAGAALSFDGTIVSATGEAVREVDPTGAGDAFDGVLLAGLARGDDPSAALAAACHAGALVAGSDGQWPAEAPA